MLKSLFNNVAGLQACNFIKKSLQHRCFPVKFAKFLRTPFFTEHLRWLLLKITQLNVNKNIIRKNSTAEKHQNFLKHRPCLKKHSNLKISVEELIRVYMVYLLYCNTIISCICLCAPQFFKVIVILYSQLLGKISVLYYQLIMVWVL